MDNENKISLPNLRQIAKKCAAQGDRALAVNISEAADEILYLREEVIKLRRTISEIRSIANMSIMGRV